MAYWKSNNKNDSVVEDEFFGDFEDVVVDDDDTNRCSRACLDGHERDSGLAVAEANSIAARHRSIGYHEAYDQYKDELIQEGFEAGYRDSYEYARQIGEELGGAAMASKLGARKRFDGDAASERIEEEKCLEAARVVKSFLQGSLKNEEDSVVSAADQGVNHKERLCTVLQQVGDILSGG